jgi:hypothetical protein
MKITNYKMNCKATCLVFVYVFVLLSSSIDFKNYKTLPHRFVISSDTRVENLLTKEAEKLTLPFKASNETGNLSFYRTAIDESLVTASGQRDHCAVKEVRDQQVSRSFCSTFRR